QYNTIAIGPGIPLASTMAKNAGTRTLFGNTQASSIATMTYQTPSVVFFTGGYTQRTVNGVFDPTSKFGVTVMLKRSSSSTSYQHVWTGGMPQTVSVSAGSPPGTVVTFGGRFDREVTDAWAFDAQRWARPKFDGFGMRTNWTPFADASLFGGAPGV